jgi:hypothetical protein
MFSARDLSFDQLYLYFSPGAAKIAEALIDRYRGKPCEAPALSDRMHLAVGHAGARERMLSSK